MEKEYPSWKPRLLAAESHIKAEDNHGVSLMGVEDEDEDRGVSHSNLCRWQLTVGDGVCFRQAERHRTGCLRRSLRQDLFPSHRLNGTPVFQQRKPLFVDWSLGVGDCQVSPTPSWFRPGVLTSRDNPFRTSRARMDVSPLSPRLLKRMTPKLRKWSSEYSRSQTDTWCCRPVR
jgi:hypothetical protein